MKPGGTALESKCFGLNRPSEHTIIRVVARAIFITIKLTIRHSVRDAS